MQYDIAADFENELAQYAHVDGLIEHIRGACGGEREASLVGQKPILAYLLRQSETVFSAYALTETGFIIAEMSSTGATLAVWIDRGRISRVYEIAENNEVVLGIEIDADVRRTETTGRERGEGEENMYTVETASSGRIIPASYEIRGTRNDRALTWFALQLRRAAH
jgi:hypothetical protein